MMKVVLPPIKVEFEIQDLQRKLRTLEHDKRAYNEEMQRELRKQRITIETIGRENRKMKFDIDQLRHIPLPTLGRKSQEEQLHDMQIQLDTLEDRLASETERKLALEDQVGSLIAKVTDLRSEMGRRGGTEIVKAETSMHAKQVHILEDRLHANLQRYNETLTRNRAVRAEIDKLRREKEEFEQLKCKRVEAFAQRPANWKRKLERR